MVASVDTNTCTADTRINSRIFKTLKTFIATVFNTIQSSSSSSSSSSSRTDLLAHFQQLIVGQATIPSQLLFHSFTTFRERGKTGEDGVKA